MAVKSMQLRRHGGLVGCGIIDRVTVVVLLGLNAGGAVGAGGCRRPVEGSSEGGKAKAENERKKVCDLEGDCELELLGT